MDSVKAMPAGTSNMVPPPSCGRVGSLESKTNLVVAFEFILVVTKYEPSSALVVERRKVKLPSVSLGIVPNA